MGPVQVLVVGFDRPAFSGEVLGELTRLREAGIVRLIDLLLVTRAEDGTLETLDVSDGADPGVGRLATAVLGRPAGLGSPGAGDDVITVESTAWSLAEAVPAGSSAAVALIEHLWAVPLNRAIHQAGGRTLEETWLPSSELEELEALIGGG
jgi:hypothetical protein